MFHEDGPCEVNTVFPLRNTKERGPLPAAWTTRPSVVVILELLGLAVSGSEVKISKAAIKQCETRAVRTLTWKWKNSLKVLKIVDYFSCFFLLLPSLRSFPLS